MTDDLTQLVVRINEAIRPKHTLATEAPAAENEVEWYGILTVEGEPSSDGRMWQLGAWSVRELPHPLSWQLQSAEGHMNSVIVGRIDNVWRTDDGKIWGSGVIGSDTEYGAKLIDQLDRGYIRGISVDGAGNPEDVQLVENNDPAYAGAHMVVAKSELMGATIVGYPAFRGAWIQLKRSASMNLPQGEPLALVAGGGIPVLPPADWFEKPADVDLSKMTVTPEGRVFGYVAQWDRCHIGMTSKCVKPPKDPSAYDWFMSGQTLCVDGSIVNSGPIVIGGDHADVLLSLQAAQKNYDNTCHAIADVTLGVDDVGIWAAGAVVPGAQPADIRRLRGGAISGDWRKDNGKWKLVAILTVNTAGSQVVRLDKAQRPISIVAAGAIEPCDECMEADEPNELTMIRQDLEVLKTAERSRRISAVDADMEPLMAHKNTTE